MFQRGLDRVTSGYPAADGFSGVARDRRSVYTHSTCILTHELTISVKIINESSTGVCALGRPPRPPCAVPSRSMVVVVWHVYICQLGTASVGANVDAATAAGGPHSAREVVGGGRRLRCPRRPSQPPACHLQSPPTAMFASDVAAVASPRWSRSPSASIGSSAASHRAPYHPWTDRRRGKQAQRHN